MDPKLELDDFVSPHHEWEEPGFVKMTQEEARRILEIARQYQENCLKESGEEKPVPQDRAQQHAPGKIIRPERIDEMDELIGMLADALGLARRIRDHMEQDQRNESIRQLDGRVREEERHKLHKMVADYQQQVAQMEKELLHNMASEYRQQLAQKEQEIQDLRKRLEDLQH